MVVRRRVLWLLVCALAVAVGVFASGLLSSSEAKNVHYPRLDRSFGTDGYAALPPHPFGPVSGGLQMEYGAATADGAVYLTSSSPKFCRHEDGICQSRAFLGRVDSDGSIATAFGDGGRVEVGEAVERLSPPLSDSEGRALVATQEGSSVTVHRYLSDGAVDTSFGTAGATSFDCGCGAPGFGLLLLAIDSEERIVVSISTIDSTPKAKVALARLLPDGSLDTGFGGGVLQLGRAAPPMGIAFGADDAIYTWAADCCQVDSLLYLHRASADGEVDSRFNARSDRALVRIVQRGVIGASQVGLIVRPRGWLDLYGGSWMIRLRTDGNAEEKFGQGAYRRLRWGILSPSLVSDGKVLALGFTPFGVKLLQLQSNGRLDREFGKGGVLGIDGVKLEGYNEDNGLGLARLRGGRAQVMDISDLTCTIGCSARPDPKLIRYRVGPAD